MISHIQIVDFLLTYTLACGHLESDFIQIEECPLVKRMLDLEPGKPGFKFCLRLLQTMLPLVSHLTPPL